MLRARCSSFETPRESAAPQDGGVSFSATKQPPALLPTAVSHRKTAPLISDI
jgi:hypothetical protein